MKEQPAFHRTELLFGPEGIRQLAATHVLLFGVGGVGSWCAEALIRTGLGRLTLVDSDVVCVTNLNRQLQATRKTIGQPKVQALKERLLEINPEAQIEAIQKAYKLETRTEFHLAGADYVLDAIDSLSHKVDLIASCLEAGVPLFSAMGAASKMDATTVRVDSIWKTHGCKLARFVRKRLRQRGVTGDCLCVYSREYLPSRAAKTACGSNACFCPKKRDDQGREISADVWCRQKAQ
ncbi:MAG: tRNA threonylcarbamoyladenosine dehydratase, partial [Kiritimatiellia bacterium]|nr:tRNA threonylcarbamoyladenosine dehydratase [Kiritimatiellia bacterium]